MERKTDSSGEFINKKVKTRQEIASEYGITVKTLKHSLKNKGIILPQGCVFPNDCQRIYEALGPPSEFQSGDEVTKIE